MILIFDYFETLVHNKSMDFNRGLKGMWEKYYKDKCSFEEISVYGEELFQHIQEVHKQGLEYAFVKDELPDYAQKYGGDIIKMTASEEADFLMKCNEMENMPYIPEISETDCEAAWIFRCRSHRTARKIRLPLCQRKRPGERGVCFAGMRRSDFRS